MTTPLVPNQYMPDLTEGLCRESKHPEAWLMETGNREGAGQWRKYAKEICERCPLRSPCEKWATDIGEHGIYGGYTRKEREKRRQEGVNS